MHYQHSFFSHKQQQPQGNAMANPFEGPLTLAEQTHQQQLLDIERRLVDRLAEVEASEGRASDLYQRATHRLGNVQERLRYYAFRSGTPYTPRNSFYAGASPFERSTASGYEQRDAEATMRRWDSIINQPMPATFGIPRRSPILEEQREERFQQGTANPHYQPIGDQNPMTGRYETFERTEPHSTLPSSSYTTANMPGVAPYPQVPEMHQDWTPTQQQDIQRMADTLRAKADVQAGTLSMDAVMRILKQEMVALNLPLPVLAAIQRVVERGQQAGWTSSKVKQELDTALGTSATPVADPYAAFPSRDTRMVGIQSASGESDAIFKTITTKMGTSWEHLRDATVGRGEQLSDEQVRFIKDPSPQKYVEGSAGTGKSTVQSLAALYGHAQGQYRLEQFIFNAKTHAATNTLKETWETLHRQGLLPGVNWERFSKQFGTLDAMFLRDLTRPDPVTGMTPLQQMNLGEYQLQGVSSPNASFEAFSQAEQNDRNSRYKLLQDMQGGLPSTWSYQKLNQEIERVRNSRTDPSVNYKKLIEQGAADVASKRLSTFESYLYRVAVNLKEQKEIDFADLPNLWMYGVKTGTIDPRERIMLGDEFQDNPRDTMAAVSRFSRVIMGGDITQQVIGNTVHVDQALPQLFPHMQQYQLSGNYRSPQSIVSFNSAIQQQIRDRGDVTGPLQVSISRDIGEPISEHVGKTYPAMYDQMVSGFYSRIGVTPQMITHNVQSGAPHPLTGYTSSPAQSPFVVQMGDEKKLLMQALARSLMPHLGEQASSVASSMVYQPDRPTAPQRFRDEATQHLIRMATVPQIKGSTVSDVFMSMPHVGQWTDIGHMKNVSVGATRPKRSLSLYSTPQDSPFSRSHDNTPVSISGELHSQLRAGGMEYEAIALSQHGAHWADMEGMHREALVNVNNRMDQSTISLDPATQAAIGPLLSMIAQIAPHEMKGFTQEGSGVVSAEQMVGGTNMDYDVNLNPDDAAAYNALAEGMGGMDAFTAGHGRAVLTGQWGNTGDPMGQNYSQRFLEVSAARGPNVWGESPYGNVGKGTRFNVPITNLQDYQKFIRDLVSPANERITNLINGPIGNYARSAQEYDFPAETVLPHDLNVKTFGSRGGEDDHVHGYQGKDEEIVRAAIYRFLMRPGVSARPALAALLKNRFFDPNVPGRMEMAHGLATGEFSGDLLSALQKASHDDVRFREFLSTYAGSGRMGQKPRTWKMGDTLLSEIDQIRDPQERALARHIFGPNEAMRSHVAVSRQVSDLAHEQASMLRGNRSPQEWAAMGYHSQGRNQAAVAEIKGLFQMLEGGMKGGHAGAYGGVVNPYGGEPIGLTSLEKELAERVARPSFNELPAAQQDAMLVHLRQVSQVRKALASGESRNQLGHTLATLFRVATGQGPYAGEEGVENSHWNHFFSGLRMSEEHPRDLPRMSTFIGGLQAATGSLQQSGTITREMLNNVLTGVGYKPDNKSLNVNRVTELQRTFSRPEDELQVEQFARARFGNPAGGEKLEDKERNYILSEMTRLPLEKGRSHLDVIGHNPYKKGDPRALDYKGEWIPEGPFYSFMGGVEGFGDIGKSQMGKLEAGTIGTLHNSGITYLDKASGKREPFAFGANFDVGEWSNVKRDGERAGIFSKREYTHLGIAKLPLGTPFGPMFQFNPGGTSHPRDWTMVRPDQLAFPEMAKRILGSREGGATPQLRYQASVPNIGNVASPDLVEIGKFLMGQHRVLSTHERDNQAISKMSHGEMQTRYKEFRQLLMQIGSHGSITSVQAQFYLSTYLHMRQLEQVLGLDPTPVPEGLVPFVQAVNDPQLRAIVDQHAHFAAGTPAPQTASPLSPPPVAPPPVSSPGASGAMLMLPSPGQTHQRSQHANFLLRGPKDYGTDFAAMGTGILGSRKQLHIAQALMGGILPSEQSALMLSHMGAFPERLTQDYLKERNDGIPDDPASFFLGQQAATKYGVDRLALQHAQTGRLDSGQIRQLVEGRTQLKVLDAMMKDPSRAMGSMLTAHQAQTRTFTVSPSSSEMPSVSSSASPAPPSATPGTILYDSFKDTPVGPLPPPPPGYHAPAASVVDAVPAGSSIPYSEVGHSKHKATYDQWNTALDAKLAGIRGALGMGPGGTGAPGGKAQIHVVADKVEINAPPGTNPAGWARIGAGQPPLSEMPGAFNAPAASTGAGATGQIPILNGVALGPGQGYQRGGGLGFVAQGGTGGGGGGGGWLSNPPLVYGHALSRTDYILSQLVQQMGQTADDAAKEGGDYRHATLQIPGAGQVGAQVYRTSGDLMPGHMVSNAGTAGFFDITSKDPYSIAALQQSYLPMYSMTQIAQGIQQYTGATGTGFSNASIHGATSVMGLASLSGMDPLEVLQLSSQTTGAQAMGRYGVNDPNAYTSQLAGMVHAAFGGNLSQVNVKPYMESMAQITPQLAGTGVANPMVQAGSIFQLALQSGMGAQNLPAVAQTLSGLNQMGSTPGLQQQYQLAQLYGEKAITASPEYFQYKQSQQQQSMQLQGLQLQQKMNVPQIQINADNAQIQMDRVSIAAQQFSLAQGQASLAFGQYIQTQQLGPIGETPQQTGRSDYFAYMRKQMAAGYNPLSADSASSFQFKGQPFGLQNVEFYAGIEHQRNMLTLGRSPLLKDAAFQEQMKYLNQQETFYNQELQLQNQQRQFTKTWSEKSLDIQGRQLKAAEAVEHNQELMLNYDKAQQEILKTNLQSMIDNLAAIIVNTSQQVQGQGPVHRANIAPSDILKKMATTYKGDDQGLQNALQGMFRGDPQSAGIAFKLIKQIEGGASLDKIQAQLSTTSDANLMKKLQYISQQGGTLGQQEQASQADTNLQSGGTGQDWKNLINAVQQTTQADKDLAQAMAPLTPLGKYISDLNSHIQPLIQGISGLTQAFGVIKGIFTLLVGGAGGAGGAGVGIGGSGGMVGPPPSSGEFSSDSSILSQMHQAAGPVSMLTRILEGLQALQMRHSGSSSYAHYGIGSPGVNADFHQKMWYGLHQGVDLQASQGSPLSEFIGGEVKATGFFPWGGEVDVEIPGGTTERYLHLSQIGVHPGQVVRRGQRIGLTGGGTAASGFGKWSHGSHLHMQYDYGNINAGIDPWVIWAMAGEKNLGMFLGASAGPAGSIANSPAGNVAGRTGGGGLFHLFGGGIAMQPLTSRLADGGEPEAVIPLSKLKSVLASVGGSGSGGGSVTTASASPSRQVQVDRLIGTLNLTVNTAAISMNEQEKDGLMSDVLDVLNTALLQFIGKIG